jgi:hypothetical protein
VGRPVTMYKKKLKIMEERLKKVEKEKQNEIKSERMENSDEEKPKKP